MDVRAIRCRWSEADYRDRPRDFDPAVADMILDRISNGELLPAVCASRDLPLPGTFLRWCDEDPSLAESYRLARIRGADVNFDEAVIASEYPDASRAGAMSRVLMWHTERSAPEKYAPRTMNRTPKEAADDPAGFDHGAEIRRRIDDMSRRLREQQAAEDSENEASS